MRAFWITSLLILGCTVLVQGQGLAPYAAAVGPGSYHHASTLEEGAARGMADVVRSAGAANLMNSEAAINIETARSQYIDNRMQATSTYFQMKALNKQARYGNKKQFDPQQAIRLTKEGLPDRLSAQKLDPLTGKIRWPIGLTMEEMAADRKKMEVLFASRAENGYLDLNQYNEVRALKTVMLDILRKNSSKLSGNFTIDARKFLESLSYEAGYQAG